MNRLIIATIALIIVGLFFLTIPTTAKANQPDQYKTFLPVANNGAILHQSHQYENSLLFTEYDRESGTYIGAFSDNGVWYPIVWVATDEDKPLYEDFFSPNAAGLITITLGINDDGDYDHFFHYFSPEYNELRSFAWNRFDTATVTISDVHTADGIQWGKMNGVIVQFTGIVSNGAATRIKSADAYATRNAHGYVVQGGLLIQYVATVE